jgi:hypothetical protein
MLRRNLPFGICGRHSGVVIIVGEFLGNSRKNRGNTRKLDSTKTRAVIGFHGVFNGLGVAVRNVS